MPKILSLLLALFVGLASLAQAAELDSKVTVSTGSVRGLYFRYGTVVADLVTKHAGAPALAVVSAGSMENLVRVQRRTDPLTHMFYYGTVQMDAAYWAINGKAENFKARPAKEIRALWAMYPDMLHLVTAAGSGINSLADLKGKKVSTGAFDSGTDMSALALLDAAGIKLSDLGFRRHMGLEQSAESLANGSLDAFFASGGLPLPALSQLAASMAAKGKQMALVDIPPDSQPIKNLVDKLPGVVQPGVIPKSA